MTMVTLPGVSRNSIGYGWPMMPGMPGGRQLAVWLSSGGGAPAAAALMASYFGVNDGPPRPLAPAPGAAPRAGALPRPPAGAAAAPRPPPPPPRSHTPLKSGSLERAFQSAAAGAL